MSDVYINLDNLTTVKAPLKTLEENTMRAANKYALNHNIFAFNALNPLLYNNVSLLRFKLSNSAAFRSGVSVYGHFSDVGGAVNLGNNSMSTIGTFENRTSGSAVNQFIQEKYDDWVFYYRLRAINSYYKEKIYDNAEFITSTFYYTSGTSGPGVSIYTPAEQMGKNRWCLISKTPEEPLPTEDYGNWYYLSNFALYNRAAGSTDERTAINAGERSGVFPVVVWDIQNIFEYARTTGKPHSGIVNGNFQGFSILNPMYANLVARLGDWRFIDTYTVKTDVTSDIAINSEYKHKSTLGDNIKFLLTDVSGMSEWINRMGETIFQTTSSTRPIMAFKSENDFLKLFADWGITRITNDIDDAKNKPAELFPGYTPEGDGFNPDGGDPEGYDTNPAIPSIPSYPDNTSDKVTPTTPNISAINAASVYALSLSGVKTLLNWLMSENFTKNISELFSDKLSAIDDLKIMPFDIVNHDTLHALYSDTLTIANVTGNVVCHKIQPNYNCIINGGSYHYTAYWGDYNDYTATSYYLYIPYGGIVELSPSFVVNRDLRLEYALDIMTGNATAIIYSNEVFVKTVPCQMGQTVPITYTNTNQREIKNTLAALNAGTTLVNMAAGKTDIVGGILNIGNTVAKTALTNPLTIGSIGNFGANTSLVMPQNPFLIISRIQQSIPANMDGIIGRPSNTHNTVGSFVGSGFVQISADHINTTATTAEQEQILNLLQGGIYL